VPPKWAGIFPSSERVSNKTEAWRRQSFTDKHFRNCRRRRLRSLVLDPRYWLSATTIAQCTRRRRNRKYTYLSHRVDVDVVLCVLGVRHEWLDEEVPKDTIDGFDPLGLASPRLHPLTSLSPRLVQSQQAALASPLDQLVWLRNEPGTSGQQPRIGGLGGIEHALDVGISSEVQRCQLGRRIVGCGSRQRGRLNDGGTSEVVVEDGLAVGLVDRFGRHGVEEGG